METTTSRCYVSFREGNLQTAHTVSSFNPASSASQREPPSAPEEDKRGKEKDIKDPQSQPQPPPLQLP